VEINRVDDIMKKIMCDKCKKLQRIIYEEYDKLNRENIATLECGYKQVN